MKLSRKQYYGNFNVTVPPTEKLLIIKTLLFLIPYTYTYYCNASVATNDVNAMNNSASFNSEPVVKCPSRDS